MTVVVDNSPTYTVTVEPSGGPRVVVESTPRHEVTVATAGMQGPPGPAGPAGPGGGAAELEFVFAVPSATWSATHDLPLSRPAVWTVDPSGDPIEGDVTFPTPATVQVAWAWPMAGTLILTT